MSPRRFAIPFLALALALTACGPPAASFSGELRAVKLLLGFRPDVQFAPFYLAQQEGYFADAGLEVTIEHSTGVLRLVADGQAAFGVADATDVMIGRTSGIPVKYVSTLYERFPVALIAPIQLSQPADLAGLRIGTPGRFGSSWHALLALLDAGGLSLDLVEIREYQQFNQVEGLLNGDVDVITGFRNNEPLQLEARGMTVSLLTVDDDAPLPGPGVVVSDELLESDRALAAAFVQAVVRAQNAVIADPEAGLAAAVRAVPTIGEDRETALTVLRATLELWGSEGGFNQGLINVPIWEAGYATMRRLGFIDGSVPVADMIDAGLLTEASGG